MFVSDFRPLPAKLDRLPLDAPFRGSDAPSFGLSTRLLQQWVTHGFLRRPLRGVYCRSSLADTLALRVACVRLAAPPGSVITDRTAAWLHGAPMALAPNDHLAVPQVSVFLKPGNRLRNPATTSGERKFGSADVVEMDELLVTSPLRTACDLGRLLHRDSALAAMDSLHSLGAFTRTDLCVAMERFRGQRGVVQGRALASIVDGRSQSPGESALRLRWYDAGLPPPELQWCVPSPHGTAYFLDLALPCCGFGAEYDGSAFHGEAEQQHDCQRREWLRRTATPTLIVVRSTNVYGRQQDAQELLRNAARANPNQCSQHRFW